MRGHPAPLSRRAVGARESPLPASWHRAATPVRDGGRRPALLPQLLCGTEPVLPSRRESLTAALPRAVLSETVSPTTGS